MDRPHKKKSAGKRLLIAEDHKTIREGLRPLFDLNTKILAHRN
jgi:hypothetical protein